MANEPAKPAYEKNPALSKAPINAKRLQQFLSLSSEIISNELSSTNDFGGSVVKLIASGTAQPHLSKREAELIYFREKSLTGNSVIKNVNDAYEVYLHQLTGSVSTKQPFDEFIEANTYKLNHKIIFFRTVNGVNKKYWFSIEDFQNLTLMNLQSAKTQNKETEATVLRGVKTFTHNETNNKTQELGPTPIQFVSLDLNCLSKDSYTSNYAVSLKIAFDNFEDLLRPCIPVYDLDVLNPTTPVSYEAPIVLLYQEYDQGQPDTRQVVNFDGIVLSQELHLNDGKRFPTLKNKKFYKNFHLTSHKHTIDPTSLQQKEQFSVALNNILTIDLVGVETDENPKNVTNPQTPRANINLYSSLLTETNMNNAKINEGDKQQFYFYTRQATNLAKEVHKYQHELTCAGNILARKRDEELRKRREIDENIRGANPNPAFVGLTPDQIDILTRVRLSPAEEALTTPDNIARLTQEVETRRNEIRELQSLIPRLLVKVIMSKLHAYSINPPGHLLSIYDANQSISDFLASWNIGETLSVATTAGMVGGAVGAGAGAAVDLAKQTFDFSQRVNVIEKQLDALSIKGQLNLALLQIKDETGYFDELTERINALEVTTNNLLLLKEQGFGENPVKTAAYVTGGPAGGFVVNKVADWTLNNLEQDTQAGFQDLANSYVPKEDSQGERIKIPFFFFGDIIKIVAECSNNSRFLIGGKSILKSSANNNPTYYFLNFADYPISYDLFLEFLNRKLLQAETTSFNYSAEVFLRDVFENLIKPAAASLDVLNNRVSKDNVFGTLFMNTTTHVETPGFIELFSKVQNISRRVNIYRQDQFEILKDYFITSQDLFNSNNANIKKVFYLTTLDSNNRVDIFKEFDQAVGRLGITGDTTYSSDAFASYIVAKSLCPAIKLRTARATDTILVDRNPKFTRLDNPNIYTGQMLSNKSIFRQQYKINAQFYPYMFHFIGNGSLMFVLPPKSVGNFDNRAFGLHGYYVVITNKFSINFLNLDKYDSKTFTVEASLDHSGEETGQSRNQGNNGNDANAACADVLNPQPAGRP